MRKKMIELSIAAALAGVKIEPVMAGTPFRRAIELSRKVNAIFQISSGPLEANALVSLLPPYKGDGGKFVKRVPRRVYQDRSKYVPHQGKHECLRRLSRRIA